ncbi:MAG: response regulator [Opitutae bacterium]|nr:response regulator [Opitutae bacterium]
MNVLIVEDDPTNRKLLRAQLEAERLTVLEAGDGVEALAVLGHAAVGAVITDILMPRMDGYRLCDAIRSSARWHRLPVVVYTATYTSPSDEKLALEVGADRYLRKPAPAELLLATLHAATRSAAASARPERSPLTEPVILREYNERLVSKLEHKNLELEAALGQLRASQQMLRDLVDGLGPDNLVGLLTPAGVVVVANQPALAIGGLDARDVLGTPLEQTHWFSHDGEAQARIRAAVGRAAAGEPSRYDVQIRADGGRLVWIDFCLRPIRDDGGRVVFLVSSATVIEDRKRAEEALRESGDRFRQVVENIGKFFGSATPSRTG